MVKKVHIDQETLAKIIHESGREAVLKNQVLKKDGAPINEIKFIEWDQLPEDAKNGRRLQAQYILGKYTISEKPVPKPKVIPETKQPIQQA